MKASPWLKSDPWTIFDTPEYSKLKNTHSKFSTLQKVAIREQNNEETFDSHDD